MHSQISYFTMFSIISSLIQNDTYTKLFPEAFIIALEVTEDPDDLKLNPGIDEYEFLGSPASTLCLTRRLALR